MTVLDYKSFFNKCNENLEAAQLCFDNGLYNACANRLYYAMFHGAVAVLIKKGYPPATSSIKHEWVQGTFARELIHRRKIFAGKFRSYLQDAQSIRDKADYREEFISKKAVSRQLAKQKNSLR